MRKKLSSIDIWNQLQVGEIGSSVDYELFIRRNKIGVESIYEIEVFVGTLETATVGDLFVMVRKGKTAFLFPSVVVMEFMWWILQDGLFWRQFNLKEVCWDIKKMDGYFVALSKRNEYEYYKWDLNMLGPFWIAIKAIMAKEV